MRLLLICPDLGDQDVSTINRELGAGKDVSVGLTRDQLVQAHRATDDLDGVTEGHGALKLPTQRAAGCADQQHHEAEMGDV